MKLAAMMKRERWLGGFSIRSRSAALLAITMALGAAGTAGMTGCGAAVAAGAGAATAVYLTSRGAGARVKGDPAKVEKYARQAMSDMNITVTGSKVEKSGAHRELSGTVGELDVTVTLDQAQSGTTQVEATARQNLVTWNKDFAKDLVSRIAAKSG